MESFFEWFRWLYDETGINLTFIYDSFDRVRLVKGFFTTVWLSAVCLVFSVIIGIVGAWLQGSRLDLADPLAGEAEADPPHRAGIHPVFPQHPASGPALFFLLCPGQPDAQSSK